MSSYFLSDQSISFEGLLLYVMSFIIRKTRSAQQLKQAAPLAARAHSDTELRFGLLE